MTAMEPFRVREATGAHVPLVVSIPHAGTHLPDALKKRLASDAMRAQPMTDWHLHELYDFLPELGVTTIFATWSRFYVDLNRAPDERPLYPGRFETGLIARQTFQGETIWSEAPTPDEVLEHRATVHAPYHARLLSLLSQTKTRSGGRAFLIDAHSVASRASKLHPQLTDEVFLGDRDGASCADWFTMSVARAFASRGYKVARNAPYKGGYITENYGRVPGVMSLQIEMAQRVYMDEADPSGAAVHRNFAKAKHDLGGVFEDLIRAIEANR